jgi:nucleoside-diphosphate-sugar epimerase
MARRALIVGGSGQIGRAAARRLLQDGWSVTAAQKRPGRLPADLIEAGAIPVTLDREAPGALASAVARGFDALIDTVAYDADHARQLLDIADDVGAFVVISSGSVYADAAGRTLDEAAVGGFPEFPVPIGEDQPTIAPGRDTYSTRKAALERTLLQGARRPVTVLRPFAIHGDGSNHIREAWFVRRIIDGRRRIPLAWSGESRFQTTATANLAELIRTVLEAPRTQVLNAADPDAPNVAEIGATIGRLYGVDLELAPLEGAPPGGVGATPWSVPAPLVADMRRAAALGYRPVGTYAETVAAACHAAEAMISAGEPFIPYIEAMFDYAAEDRVFVGGRE